MKSTLNAVLLATVLVAGPALAADMNASNAANPNATTDERLADGQNATTMHHKHWRHHRHTDEMANKNYINHDANPNYAAVDHPQGWRDQNGNWHHANERYGYANNGRQYGYNDYYNRNADAQWMGIDFNSRHMTDGSDTDSNNRGRHAFIFGDNESPQDFRVGSGHVVKF